MKKIILGFVVLMSFTLFAQKEKKAALMLKEGPDGVYVLLGNQRISKTDAMNDHFIGAIIYRATGNEKFREIGQLKPSASPSDFKAILGAGALMSVAELKKLKSEAEAWEYIQQHPKLSEYGFLAMNLKFGVALGAYFLDKDISTKEIADVRYQVKFIMKDGKTAEPIEGKIQVGHPADIPSPKYLSKIETDSFVVIKWYLPARTASEAVFANVFRSVGNSNKYESAGKIVATINQPIGDSVLFKWEDKIKTGYSYNYFIQPATMAFHTGANSDTVNIIGANFSALQQISGLKSTDTMQGIFLKWTALPNSTIYSGLAIERSSQSVGPYITIDTIPASAVKYLDTKIQPNQSYYYRIHAVTIRGINLSASDNTVGMHANNSNPPDAPRNLTIANTAKGRVLKWKKNIEPDLAGYYVFRSSSSESMDVISLLVKDTSFVDTATLRGRNTYYYEVKAYNNNNISSMNSNRVSFQPDNNELPRTPTGIKGYAEVQRNTISWDDVMPLDKFIKGYNIYRKEGKASFTKENNQNADLTKSGYRKLNTESLTISTFTDKTSTSDYSYCITSVDVFGMESYATDALSLQTVKVAFMPPSNVSARKTSKGIEVNWDKTQQIGVKQYVVYRRAATEVQAAKLGTADETKELFVDTTAKSGTTYFYSVVVSDGNNSSEKSLEAGVIK